jgi:hypothetical protein
MIRFASAPQISDNSNHEVASPMANDDTLARALADVRTQRAVLETEYERIGSELSKLRLAEKSLAAIVEGIALDDSTDDQPGRRKTSSDDDRPRATRGSRGPRGPRANSAKGRLKALLEEAGSRGLTHAEIADRLTDVAANTLNTYLSVMSNSGELERQGDVYRSGTSPADASGDQAVEDDASDDEAAEAAE